jgi:thiol-disulfide isomerase/thioredoxin
MRRLLASVTAVVLALGLAACSAPNDDLAEQYREGSNKGFISGDGSVQEVPVADRDEPVVFEGTGIDGETISSADYTGDVLVLNFWYAGCGPCRAEAPLLQSVADEVSDDGGHFLGVNIYDGPEQARAFEETYGVAYPSLLLRGDADLKLAFASVASVQAAPTTLVLDREGRVAARFLGQVRNESVLRTIVDDTLAEEQ